MITDIPLLRFMLLSSLIGFMAFCASYAILVWKKRRSSSASAATARTRLRRWAVTGVVLGCLGFAVTLVVREAVRADGMLGGAELYTVRGSGEVKAVQVVDDGATVKQGDVLARFSSPEAQADIQKAELDLEQLKSEKENIGLAPLPRDPELVRQHNLLEARANQLEASLKGARDARETAARENRPPIATHLDLVGNLAAEIETATGDLKAATKKLDIARQQLKRETELSKKGNSSLSDLNDREKEVFGLDADVVKYEARLSALKERQRVAKETLGKLQKEADEQDARLKTDIDGLNAQVAALQDVRKYLERQMADDLTAAQKRQENARAKLEIAIRQAEVAIASRQDKLEVKAPFDGKVIFRHASPATALKDGPIVVLAKHTGGMQLHFRLPEAQVPAIEKAGTIMIELDETANTVEQRFPGKFLKATTLDRDPGMALVDFDCQVPPETVAALADGKPVKARFSWRPPLMNLWPFPVSAVLFGLGLVGLIVVGLTGWSPARKKDEEPEDESDDVMVTLTRVPAPKEGDTAEAAFDTIPVRPELPMVPREKPSQPWEHPVGIRLRDAIVREEITGELMDAVEGAIEFQKDAVIVPMREALRRVASVPDHARKLVQKLNDFETADEMKLIEKRCLAQRLTFLLYTLGIDIHAKAERPVVSAR